MFMVSTMSPVGVALVIRSAIQMKKIKAYIPVIVSGLFISILKGREIARTIEARGFTYNPEKRTYRKTIKLRTRDYVIITLSILLTIAVLYLKHSRGWFGVTFILSLFGK